MHLLDSFGASHAPSLHLIFTQCSYYLILNNNRKLNLKLNPACASHGAPRRTKRFVRSSLSTASINGALSPPPFHSALASRWPSTGETTWPPAFETRRGLRKMTESSFASTDGWATCGGLAQVLDGRTDNTVKNRFN